jgi:hypothetical protein
MEYIRKNYGVPAKRGMRVRSTDPNHGQHREGVIVGSTGARLRVWMDGEDCSLYFHPTSHLTYLNPDGSVAATFQA